MARILVLGGAGFIGHHLATRLVGEGHALTLVDDFSRGKTDAALEALCAKPGVALHRADLTRPGALDALPRDWEQVYMLAAVVGVRHVERDPARVIRVNTLALLHVLEWPENEVRGHHAWFAGDYRSQLESDTLHELRAAVPAEARSWCDVHERVALGTPWRQIVHTLRSEHADLAVLGVQGANAIERLVFGSTANEVVRHAPCPVLTVRPVEHA